MSLKMQFKLLIGLYFLGEFIIGIIYECEFD